MHTASPSDALAQQLAQVRATQHRLLAGLAATVVAVVGLGVASQDRGVIGDINAVANDPPVGTILAFAGDWPRAADGHPEIKNGWVLCEGQEYPASELPELYLVIQKLYGATSNEAWFKVPDLRGMFLRGVDLPAGVDKESQSSRYALPVSHPFVDMPAPVPQNGVGSWQFYATARAHKDFVTDLKGGHSHKHPDGFHRAMQSWTETNRSTTGGALDAAGAVHEPGLHNSAEIHSDGEHQHTVLGGDAETRPVNVAVYWIIKATRP